MFIYHINEKNSDSPKVTAKSVWSGGLSLIPLPARCFMIFSKLTTLPREGLPDDKKYQTA